MGRAHKLRQNPASVYVADHQNGQRSGLGEPHIGNIGRAEIHFGQAARALHENEVGFLLGGGETGLKRFPATARAGVDNRQNKSAPPGGPRESAATHPAPRA